MRSRRIHFRLPEPLYRTIEDFRKTHGYDTLSAFMIGCCINVIQSDRSHVWIRSISNAKPNTQDFLINQFLNFPMDLDGMTKVFKAVRTRKRTK